MKVKYGFINLIGIIIWTNAFTQSNVVITKFPQKVPPGKIWILPTNQKIVVEISNGSLISGTSCYAYLHSNPRILTGILEGDYGNPNKGYAIVFRDIKKEPNSNEFTYSIYPTRLIDGETNISNLFEEPIENIGENKLTFTEGQTLYVSNCLESIHLIEYKEKDVYPQHQTPIYKKKSTSDVSGTAAGLGFESTKNSFELDGRVVLTELNLDSDFDESGKVVVNITVDSKGNVIDAKPGYRGSTTINSVLLKKAKEAALKTKFNVVDTIPEQNGTITFIFQEK